jgi:hypothetical protein
VKRLATISMAFPRIFKFFMSTVKMQNFAVILSFVSDDRQPGTGQRRLPAAIGAEGGLRRQRNLHRHPAQRRHPPRRRRCRRASRRDEKRHEPAVSKDVEPSRIFEPSAVRRKAIRQLLRIVLGGQQGSGRAGPNPNNLFDPSLTLLQDKLGCYGEKFVWLVLQILYFSFKLFTSHIDKY